MKTVRIFEEVSFIWNPTPKGAAFSVSVPAASRFPLALFKVRRVLPVGFLSWNPSSFGVVLQEEVDAGVGGTGGGGFVGVAGGGGADEVVD